MHLLHALVIGGTGMLADVSLHFANDGYAVSIIGRSKEKFMALTDDSFKPLFFLKGDYNSEEIFPLVAEAMEARGPIDIIVSWTSNDRMLERICKMNGKAEKFILIHVKGSKRFFQDKAIEIEPNCDYRKIFLGFKIEENNARWLTHKEIADGVINQVDSIEKESIIGQIQPYEKRPQ